MSRYELIKNQLSNQKTELSRRFGITQIGIFGSLVKGTSTSTSDIDLLYTLEEGKKIGFIEMDELEAFIKRTLNFERIDLVNKKRLNPLFKDDILSNVDYV
jgi:predicted nucleotidyltransferase